jgi:G3E family GTPase
VKVATLVLTGFLGAGKTTLLNRLIAARAEAEAAAPAPGRGKLAIVVNELGAVGVDGDLLPRGAARQVELPGGCVCCVLADDLDRTLLEILDGNPDVETVVIETTGVAEPLPIVWTLERAPLAERLRVAAVVTLVDPISFEAARGTSEAAEIQVEAADVLMLSKADATTEAERAAARSAVAALAPATPVVEGTADEQVQWLLGVLEDPEAARRRAHHGHGHDHEGAHAHDDADAHDHGHQPAGGPVAHGVSTVAVAAPGLVDLEQLEDELAALPAGYFRIKGIVWAVDPRRGAREPSWAAVHRVGARVSSEPVEPPREPGRLVALGRDVDHQALAAALATAALAGPPPAP